jgi:hypothetical protein
MHKGPTYNAGIAPGDAWYGDDPVRDSSYSSELAAEADGAERQPEFDPDLGETSDGLTETLVETEARLDALTPDPKYLIAQTRMNAIRTTISGFTQDHDPLA